MSKPVISNKWITDYRFCCSFV